jgi:hypothetical protein
MRNCALGRMIQYSRDLRLNREAAAYWIPAFAGMTSSAGAYFSVAVSASENASSVRSSRSGVTDT